MLLSSIQPENAVKIVKMCEPQIVLGKDKAFKCDYVFDVGTDQQEIYSVCVKNHVEGLACNVVTVGHSCHIFPTQLFQWFECNSAGSWTGNAATIACVVHVLYVQHMVGVARPTLLNFIMASSIDWWQF